MSREHHWRRAWRDPVQESTYRRIPAFGCSSLITIKEWTDATHTVPHAPPAALEATDPEQKFLEQVHLNAAGIDIGSGSHWVAVPTDRDEQPVREFRSFTHALIDLADWLTACDIDTVAMESTGCIGSRSMKCWRQEASRCSSSMPARQERARTQMRCVRLPVDPAASYLWLTARQLPAHRGDHRHPDLLRHRDTLVEGAAPVSNGCRRR